MSESDIKKPDSVSNLELCLLVGISLFGLGVLFILGYLDVPIVEQIQNIPIISNTNYTP